MENATKALLIAAGVLIGVMILTLGIYLYASLGTYVADTQKTMEQNALNAFNTQFLNYINYSDGATEDFELKIQDVISVASIAYENNQEYEFADGQVHNETSMYVTVSMDAVGHLEQMVSSISSELLKNNIDNRYKCTPNDIKISPITGRVYHVNFRKIPN